MAASRVAYAGRSVARICPYKALRASQRQRVTRWYSSTSSVSDETERIAPRGAVWAATGHGEHGSATPHGQRYKLDVEYFGTRYSGFMRQPEQHTVQGCLELAVSRLTQGVRVANAQPFVVRCSGRTDAGVHALNQVVHVDITRLDKRTLQPTEPFTEEVVLRSTNNALQRAREDIRVTKVQKVPFTFHARFSTLERSYLYRILFACERQPLAETFRSWHVPTDLDVDAMKEAAQHFVGQHDFTSFRSARCENPNPVRQMHSVDISTDQQHILQGISGQPKGNLMQIRLSANGFLYNQVRIMTKALVAVGQGKLSAADIPIIMAEKKRPQITNEAAPPHGLYLAEITYPPEALEI